MYRRRILGGGVLTYTLTVKINTGVSKIVVKWDKESVTCTSTSYLEIPEGSRVTWTATADTGYRMNTSSGTISKMTSNQSISPTTTKLTQLTIRAVTSYNSSNEAIVTITVSPYNSTVTSMLSGSIGIYYLVNGEGGGNNSATTGSPGGYLSITSFSSSTVTILLQDTKSGLDSIKKEDNKVITGRGIYISRYDTTVTNNYYITCTIDGVSTKLCSNSVAL